MEEKVPIRTTHADFVPENASVIDRVFMPAYMALVLAYSLLTSYFTGAPWWTMCAFYAFFMTCFFLWHFQAHKRYSWIPFNKKCFQYHTVHHWKTFPPTYFYGSAEAIKMYGDPTYATTWKGALPLSSSPEHEALIFLLFGIVIFVARVILNVSWATLGFATFEALVIGVVGNYLHMSFHRQDHWLAKYSWWRELRVIHYIHHLGTGTHHLAMANFALDKMFRMYFKDIETFKAATADAQKAAALETEKGHSADLANALANLPPGVTLETIQTALQTSPLAYALFMGGSDAFAASRAHSLKSALSRGPMAVFVRVLLVTAGYIIYQQLQGVVVSINGSFGPVPTNHIEIFDRGHALFAGLTSTLTSDPSLSAFFVGISSLLNDAAAVIAISLSIFGSSVRPCMGLIAILCTRAMALVIVHMPSPPGCMWVTPTLQQVFGAQVPSLFGISPNANLPTFISSFGNSHQMFYSGSAALAVLVATEMLRSARRHKLSKWTVLFLAVIGLGLVLFQTVSALALRAHWSVDIVVGLLVGRYAALGSRRYSGFFDALLP